MPPADPADTHSPRRTPPGAAPSGSNPSDPNQQQEATESRNFAQAQTKSLPAAKPGLPDPLAETEFRSSPASSVPPADVAAAGLRLPCRFGDYDLLAELGKGGMGVVYKARQRSANRLVALKLIRPDQLSRYLPEERLQVLARFRNEVQAAAQLEHDHVVTVYDVGEVAGQSYYAMRLVDGESLNQHIANGPLEPEVAARYIEQVARALAEAHARGILHRDLKPHNVMLDTKTDRALLADFGLAKLGDGDQQLTASSSALGSPPYMSPEQTLDSGKVTTASDIYGLGATLYHLLTCRPPFQAASATATMLQVQTKDPVSPRELNSAVPLDLETICLKCLEKEPYRRYSTTSELADRLALVQRGEPIPERPISRVERTRRWCQKNPVVAGLISAVAAALVVGITVSSTLAVVAQRRATELTAKTTELQRANTNLSNETIRANQQRDLAIEEEKKSSRRLNHSQIARAQQMWDKNEPKMAWEHLQSTRSDLREWEYDYLFSRFHVPLSIKGHKLLVNRVAFSPDGQRIVSSSADKTLKLWDAASGEELRTFRGHTGAVYEVSFSPDGTRILSSALDHTLKLWDANSGAEIYTIPVQTKVVRRLTFSPNGEQILGVDESPKVWDVGSGKEVYQLRGHSAAVSSVQFSPDGLSIASCSADKTVKLWDAASGAEIRTFKGHANHVYDVAFNPDGKQIVSCSYDKTLKLWDTQSGVEMRTLKGHTRPAYWVKFSPTGQQILSGGDDQTLKLWNAATGQEVRSFDTLSYVGQAAAFSSDGRYLVTPSAEKALKLWDAKSGQEIRTLKTHETHFGDVKFSLDGQRIASCSSLTVDVWHIGTDSKVRTLQAGAGRVVSVAFSPDSQQVISGSSDNTLRLWHAVSGEELRRFKGHTHVVTSVTWSRDGRRILSASADKTMKLWDIASVKAVRTFKGHTDSVSSAAFSPDGKRIVSGSVDNTVKLWDVETGHVLRTLTGHIEPVQTVAFSPNGKVIVSGSADFTIKIWDAETGQEVHKLQHHNVVDSVAFSPDGTRIVSGSHDFTVKMWDVLSGAEIWTSKGHTLPIFCVAFSPDGKRIISGSHDTNLRLWDAASGEEICMLQAHAEHVFDVAFSPDGQRIASGSSDETLKVWEAYPRNHLACRELAAEYEAAGRYDKAGVYRREALRQVSELLGANHFAIQRYQKNLEMSKALAAQSKAQYAQLAICSSWSSQANGNQSKTEFRRVGNEWVESSAGKELGRLAEKQRVAGHIDLFDAKRERWVRLTAKQAYESKEGENWTLLGPGTPGP